MGDAITSNVTKLHIATATPLDDPRVKALAEALLDMTALAIQLGAIDLETRDALAALSALEGKQ